jgi:DNA-binding CsgD family transcriptional regulator
MESKIAVVHRSEIVRRGLVAVLNPIWKSDIVQSENLEVFLSRGYCNTCRSLVFLEAELKGQANSIPGKTSLVLVYNVPPSVPDSEIPVNISLLSDYETLRQIIDEFKTQASSGGLNENELTQRETEILRQVAMGYSNKEIADSLFISIHTVITHRKNITGKLGIKSISGLTVYAIINHLIDPELIDPEKLI